jgi:hypothetical protein
MEERHELAEAFYLKLGNSIKKTRVFVKKNTPGKPDSMGWKGGDSRLAAPCRFPFSRGMRKGGRKTVLEWTARSFSLDGGERRGIGWTKWNDGRNPKDGRRCDGVAGEA